MTEKIGYHLVGYSSLWRLWGTEGSTVNDCVCVNSGVIVWERSYGRPNTTYRTSLSVCTPDLVLKN